jgi:hypothetical protein
MPCALSRLAAAAAAADIKQRVRKEVFEGREARGWHRQGAELAAAAVLSFAVASYVLYARYTGWLAGLVLGECQRDNAAVAV